MRSLALLTAYLILGAAGADAAFAQTALQADLPPVRVGGGIPPPIKTTDVKPVYPPEAAAARVQGTVVLEATVAPDGAVRDAHVMRSLPQLDAAALDAVRQWRFKPTMVDGVPRSVVMTVTVSFSLGLPSGASAGAQPQGAATDPARMIEITSLSGPAGRYVFEIA